MDKCLAVRPVGLLSEAAAGHVTSSQTTIRSTNDAATDSGRSGSSDITAASALNRFTSKMCSTSGEKKHVLSLCASSSHDEAHLRVPARYENCPLYQLV